MQSPQLHADQLVLPAGQAGLPLPGTMVHLSHSVNPPVLKGIKVYRDNPFRFDFIINNTVETRFIASDTTTLVKYFLAALTTPEQDMWVNLSPYEKDRIVPDGFGQTQMGRDLLAQDYILKQITASLIYPEDAVGKEFWKRVYASSANKNIPINTFNKVWIVPNKAVVYENLPAGRQVPNEATAYVVESSLKVLTEQDYLANQRNKSEENNNQIIKDVVIPQLTKEINEGANFAQLRQVYNALILATWYKKKIKNSILSKVYADQNRIAGVNIDDPEEKQKIYARYLEAFKKGAYNYIKEDTDTLGVSGPRKYFSGGMKMDMTMMEVVNNAQVKPLDKAMVVEVKLEVASLLMRVALGLSEQEMSFVNYIKSLDLKNGSDILAIGATPEKEFRYGKQQVRVELLFAALDHHVTLFQPYWNAWDTVLDQSPWKKVRKIDYFKEKFTSESKIAKRSQDVVVMMAVMSAFTTSIPYEKKLDLMQAALDALKDDGYLMLGWYNWGTYQNGDISGEREEFDRTNRVIEAFKQKGYVFNLDNEGSNTAHRWHVYKVTKPDSAMATPEEEAARKRQKEVEEMAVKVATEMRDEWGAYLRKKNDSNLNYRIEKALIDPVKSIVSNYLLKKIGRPQAIRELYDLGINRRLSNSMLDWAGNLFYRAIDVQNKTLTLQEQVVPFTFDQMGLGINKTEARAITAVYTEYLNLSEGQSVEVERYLVGDRDWPYDNLNEQKLLDSIWMDVKYKMSDDAFGEFYKKEMITDIKKPETVAFLKAQGYSDKQINEMAKDAGVLWKRWELIAAESKKKDGAQVAQDWLKRLDGMVFEGKNGKKYQMINSHSALYPEEYFILNEMDADNNIVQHNAGYFNITIKDQLIILHGFAMHRIEDRKQSILSQILQIFPQGYDIEFEDMTNLPTLRDMLQGMLNQNFEGKLKQRLELYASQSPLLSEKSLDDVVMSKEEHQALMKLLVDYRDLSKQPKANLKSLETIAMEGFSGKILGGGGINSPVRIEFKKINDLDVVSLYVKRTKDSAQQVETPLQRGGIDFNADKMQLEAQHDDGGIDFQLDPAQIKQFQDVEGFTPNILSMQPIPAGQDGINVVKTFLGMTL